MQHVTQHAIGRAALTAHNSVPLLHRLRGTEPPAARSKLRTMLRLKAAVQAAKPEELLPLPDGINQSTPGIAIAWQWFQRVDRNKSGVLELAEVGTLAKHLGLEWTAKQTKRSYVER